MYCIFNNFNTFSFAHVRGAHFLIKQRNIHCFSTVAYGNAIDTDNEYIQYKYRITDTVSRVEGVV